MINSLTIQKNLFDILDRSELRALLNGGGIYLQARPTDSDLKDIVINVNFSGKEQTEALTSGIANVNIYTQATDKGQADTILLTTITDKILKIFSSVNYNLNGFYFKVKKDNIFPENDNRKWYYFNFTLDFQNNNN